VYVRTYQDVILYADNAYPHTRADPCSPASGGGGGAVCLGGWAVCRSDSMHPCIYVSMCV
jgi:hypothetical protein